MLRKWREREGRCAAGVVAALRCGVSGFLAACRHRAAPCPSARPDADRSPSALLLASLDGCEATDEPRAVHRAVLLAGAGAPAECGASAVAEAIAAIERWDARRVVLDDAGIADGVASQDRRRVIRRIAAIARRVPAHRRVDMAALAATARRAVLARRGAGGEWLLRELAGADLPDEAWLCALRDFGEGATTASAGGRGDDEAPRRVDVEALLLLRP